MAASRRESSVAVVGAGVFGAAAALELRRRGFRVALIDRGPLPHPLAASTDISKVIRVEYGADEEYMILCERAMEGWHAWRARWSVPLFHPVGLLMLSRAPMAPGGFEHDSHALLLKRGHRPERMNAARLARRFPAWRAELYPDGFLHSIGGFAESGRVVQWMIGRARAEGVELFEGLDYRRWIERDGEVRGIECAGGERIEADHVVLASGTWLGRHHPDLKDCLRSVAQPVFHLRPADPEPFRAERFPVFTADIARTGWYGFPVTPQGIVKVANHGAGREVDPDAPREATSEEEARMRAFVAESIPALAEAPIAERRTCLYCDSRDGHFWIAADPSRRGLTVAGGGSGHGFKFAPVIGGLIADAVEGKVNEFTQKFRWRPEIRPAEAEEAARCRESAI